MADFLNQFNNSVLSADELRQLTSWPPQVIDDYLSIVESLLIVARDVSRIDDDVHDAPTQEEFDDLLALVNKNINDILNLQINDLNLEQAIYAW